MEQQTKPPPARVFIRLQESSEYLNVAAAYAQQPALVLDALLEAIHLVPPRALDYKLLQIEDDLRAALSSTWKVPIKLGAVLRSCQQGSIESRAERLFFEHGREFAIVVLGVATRLDNSRWTKHDGRGLFHQIDALSDAEIAKLVKYIKEFSKPSAVNAFLKEFAKSAEGPVLPRGFDRLRSRRKNTTGDAKISKPANLGAEGIVNAAVTENRDSVPPNPDLPDASRQNKRKRSEYGSDDPAQGKSRLALSRGNKETMPTLSPRSTSNDNIPKTHLTTHDDKHYSPQGEEGLPQEQSTTPQIDLHDSQQPYTSGQELSGQELEPEPMGGFDPQGEQAEGSSWDIHEQEFVLSIMDSQNWDIHEQDFVMRLLNTSGGGESMGQP